MATDYDIDNEDKGMTYEDVLKFLEDELNDTTYEDNPYKPLNFHDSDEDMDDI